MTKPGHRRKPTEFSARQIWKMDGRSKAVERGEEGCRRKKGTELYVICEERRLSWKELAELEDGKTAEVMVEMRGGMGKKKSRKNPCITPSQSSGSEPEMVRTETEGSSRW